MFFPPSTTSMIQPCNQAILVHLKPTIGMKCMEELEELEDEQNISRNELVKKSLSSGNIMVSPTIKNYFVNAGFFKDESDDKLKPLETTENVRDMI